jgi:hypothetical protein
MKLRITIVLSLLAFALSVGFISCGPEENLPDAKLFSMSIGSDVYSVEPARIPGGISNNDYINYFDRDGYRYDYEEVGFNKEDEGYTEGMRIKTTVSDGARSEWGIGGRSERPTVFYATGVPVEFKANQYIYIKVTSMDGYVVNYYRFFARIFSPVKELAELKVAGRYATLGAPGDSEYQALNGSLSIRESESASALLEAETFDTNATVKYAVGGTPSSSFDWSSLVYEPVTRLNIVDRQWLYVEVTAENTFDKYYYRLQMNVGRMVTINTLKFIGEDPSSGRAVTEEAVGKGAPGEEWSPTGGNPNDRISAGAFDSAFKPPAGFKISLELDDPDGEWEYGVVNNLTAGEPSWATYTANGVIPIDNTQYLAVKITPKNELAYPSYYKVRVNLLAAAFKVHPKAAVYGYEATAVPLTFELDRDISGATYQWYEANSWYGGYGFDKNGNIQGTDAAYAGDKYHEGLDEKGNVSFFNGGSGTAEKWFRLPLPGDPIPVTRGGTSQAYTPLTDKKPFIDGFTNVTHYYWVVVTAPGGVTATSQRAVILTEHNKTYDKGVPGAAVVKKNLVIDMPNLKDKPGVEGVSVPIKNPTAFTTFRQPFAIDLRGALPPDFNVKDYSMATAWAKFYLKDGTPWIQNWTQGNISFIENTSQDGDKEKIVLYYNLTNNNGTLGMKGDGKEPSGGSLDKNFTHVVVMPSGEKSPRAMPPLTADGTPDYSEGEAQGWFCGFIELVELRFEGPPQQ